MQAREDFRRANASNETVRRPVVEACVAAFSAILDQLETAHRKVADDTRLDLLSPSREAAAWLLTGRCIALARASVDLVGLGYATDALPTIRSLREANRLLSVVALGGEDDLVERWVEGRSVGRANVMRASRLQEERIRLEMLRAGAAPPPATGSFFDRQYGRWSEFAHHRRRHLVDQVDETARTMACGRHPDWRVRAAMVDHLGDVVGELLSVGGHALSLCRDQGTMDEFQLSFVALMDMTRRLALAERVR